MSSLDRFGGAAAWDRYCADEDAALQELQRENPGCETCANAVVCPECGAIYCEIESKWTENISPLCEYEGYER